MFIPRIYLPLPLQEGEAISLPDKISHYLLHVLRQPSGAPLIVFNGEGGEYHAHFQSHKKSPTLMIERYDPVDRSSPCAIHLGQALIRGDRMDFVIQKATELGVTSITPLISQHCIAKVEGTKKDKRMTHWMNIAISASEQCGRTILPTIMSPMLLSEWAQQAFVGTSLVFEMGSQQTLRSISPSSAFRVAIGPESGWHENEVRALQEAQFIPCTLGPRTLRTETAGIVSVALLQGLFGDN